MMRICGLLLLLSAAIGLNSQTSWFLADFDVIDHSSTLNQIILLEDYTKAILDDFNMLDNDNIAFSRFHATSKESRVDFVSIERSVKGRFVYAEFSISNFNQIPGTTDQSFIIHGTPDRLVKFSGDRVIELYAVRKLLDYCWINSDMVALISIDDHEKTTCSYLNIKSDEQQIISLNPGENVERISDNEIAFLDIFSSEYRYIKTHNIAENRSRIVVKLPAETNRFAVDSANYYITLGNKIMRFVPNKDADWKPFFIFSAYPFNKIQNLQIIENNRFIFSHEH